jgi:hypothetical protein
MYWNVLSMTGTKPSPLTSLVLFMICLAIAGSFLAGAHYYAIDQPQQKTVVAPANSGSLSCQECYDWCAREHPNSGGCKYNCQVYICNKQ